MKFTEIVVNFENRFSLGIDAQSGDYFLSIPVSNQMVDYEEYYRIDEDQFTAMQHNTNLAINFAVACRQRKHDARLFLKPGTDRGVPV